jgi:hypothetical protein
MDSKSTHHPMEEPHWQQIRRKIFQPNQTRQSLQEPEDSIEELHADISFPLD